MLICVDVGNTDIDIGVFEEGILHSKIKMDYDKRQTYENFLAGFKTSFLNAGIRAENTEGCAVCSVVSVVTGKVCDALRDITERNPLLFRNDLSGIKILTDDPMEVGADIVASCIAAEKLPAVVTDMGTATSVTRVDENGAILGVSIMPGILLSRIALENSTGLVVDRKLSPPAVSIGKNTPQSLSSGIILGRAGSVDRINLEFEKELGSGVTRYITGGGAKAVLPFCREKYVYDPDLLLKGLYGYYNNINRK